RCEHEPSCSVPRRGLTQNKTHARVKLALYWTARGRLSLSEAKVGERNPSFTHGQSRQDLYGTGAYKSWGAMKKRCTYPRHPWYHTYSKLGLCDEWYSFSEFYAAMGDRPPGHELDRIDPTVGYFAGNVRWLPASENAARAHRGKTPWNKGR